MEETENRADRRQEKQEEQEMQEEQEEQEMQAGQEEQETEETEETENLPQLRFRCDGPRPCHGERGQRQPQEGEPYQRQRHPAARLW